MDPCWGTLRPGSGRVYIVDVFQRVPAAPVYDVAELQKFSGTNVSPELGAVYRFRVSDGKPNLRVASRRWEPMKPLVADEFSPIVRDPHDTRFIRFTRDEAGNVTGFSISFWRIDGVRFDRLKDA